MDHLHARGEEPPGSYLENSHNMYSRNRIKKCAFCESEIARRVIASNRHAKVFLTYTPIVPGHILICPIKCVLSIDELDENELLSIFELRRQMKPVLARIFDAEGFNYAWNENTVAGQTVPHLHLHMLPRRHGDSGTPFSDPRQFLYRPRGDRPMLAGSELSQLSAMLAKEFCRRNAQ
jgi:diadenosine tetraphosphate (Ap4A) HIT family hydrolase